MSKPPIIVRLIALLLIVLGTLSVVEMIVGFTLRNSYVLNLSFLFIFVGLGMLRRSEKARGCASLLIITTGMALVFAFFASIYYWYYPKPPSVSIHASIPVCLTGIALSVYAWKSLYTQQADDWFYSLPSVEESQRPFQFRISTLLFLTLLVAFACVAYRSEILYHPRNIKHSSKATTNGISRITTAIRRHRRDDSLSVVDFVVFENHVGRGPFSSSVKTTYSHSSSDPTATFTTPTGQTVELPNDIKLYEITDGKLNSSDQTVTVEQLEKYLDNLKGPPSLDALLSTPVPFETKK